jgi:hypothetical protein
LVKKIAQFPRLLNTGLFALKALCGSKLIAIFIWTSKYLKFYKNSALLYPFPFGEEGELGTRKTALRKPAEHQVKYCHKHPLKKYKTYLFFNLTAGTFVITQCW